MSQIVIILCTFNSRPHKEVDGFQILLDHDRLGLSIHDLTRRSTITMSIQKDMWDFQFTTSQGGRPDTLQPTFLLLNLSIHDLTRRSTRRIDSADYAIYLSIHDLTRRSTFPSSSVRALPNLSIHDLTRRSTKCSCYSCRD